MQKQGYIYILTNKRKSVLYIGVTSDLQKRVYEHQNGLASAFTKKYNVSKLIYYEVYDDIESAIAREKSLKGKTRKKKEDLIATMNPEWRDLSQLVL